MSQEVKLETEKPNIKLEPEPNAIFEPGLGVKLECQSRVKVETEKPTVKIEPGPDNILESGSSEKTEVDKTNFKIEPGPSGLTRPEPKLKTETGGSGDEMDTSADNESDEDDSSNPDDYHPVIICDGRDPYRDPTDVGDLVVNVGSGKKKKFEIDTNGDYKCPETSCKYITKKKYLLTRHYQTHGEKQYACKLCEKKFAKRETCMNHIRTQDDRYKFRCDECRKRFSVYRQLKNHCRAKHGIELEPRPGREWIFVGPDYEPPLPPLPRMNSRGKLW